MFAGGEQIVRIVRGDGVQIACKLCRNRITGPRPKQRLAWLGACKTDRTAGDGGRSCGSPVLEKISS